MPAESILSDDDAAALPRMLPSVIPSQKTSHLKGVHHCQIHIGLAPEAVGSKKLTHLSYSSFSLFLFLRQYLQVTLQSVLPGGKGLKTLFFDPA